VELGTPAPFDAPGLFAFFATRAVPGIEAFADGVYHRTLDLPHGHGVAELRAGGDDHQPVVVATLRLEDGRDVDLAVRRIRRLLDLDADPLVVDSALAEDSALAASIAATPGRRLPGSVDPFETAVRAVVGQQISVAGARTIAGRIVAAVGTPLRIDAVGVDCVFPTPSALASIDPTLLPMPASRRRTVVELAARVTRGDLVLNHDADRDNMVAALLDVPGIGPWTAGYVRMRGLGDPDVFLPTDLGVKVGLRVLGIEADRAERWRPWRSYALHHLWAVP